MSTSEIKMNPVQCVGTFVLRVFLGRVSKRPKILLRFTSYYQNNFIETNI